jgi:hypothetical protein
MFIHTWAGRQLYIGQEQSLVPVAMRVGAAVTIASGMSTWSATPWPVIYAAEEEIKREVRILRSSISDSLYEADDKTFESYIYN